MAKRRTDGKIAKSTLLDEIAGVQSAEAALEADRKNRQAAIERNLARGKYAAAMAQLAEMEQRLEVLTGLNSQGKLAKWSRPKRVKHGAAAAIAVLSDWHCEETVLRETTNGLNEFNLGIADARIKRTFDRLMLMIEDARSLVNVQEAVVHLGGDIITGYIHEELEEMNALAPLPAARWAQQRIEAGLQVLLDQAGLKRILVVCNHGNHGRVQKRPRIASAASNSFEHNLYLTLRDRFAGEKRLDWCVADGYFAWVDVLGHACRFHHGDAVRYQGGVGGVTIPLNKAIASWNKARPADYDFLGHWHQFCWPTMRCVMNGSLIGYSPYGEFVKAEYQPPYQAFAVIDRDRGMTRAMPIFCD